MCVFCAVGSKLLNMKMNFRLQRVNASIITFFCLLRTRVRRQSRNCVSQISAVEELSLPMFTLSCNLYYVGRFRCGWSDMPVDVLGSLFYETN
jgi:hypothetical protein